MLLIYQMINQINKNKTTITITMMIIKMQKSRNKHNE
jgi:hypothetical protein